MTRSTSAAASASAAAVASVLGELRRSRRRRYREGCQAVVIPAGTDHPAGSEPLGDLDRHRSGVARRPQHQHRLSGLDRHPAAQRHPGGHGRVHGGGDLLDVGAVGQRNAPAHVDDCLLGHRAGEPIIGDEEDPSPVSGSADPVHAGNHREPTGTGVVPAGGVGPHPGVQPDGQHVDEHLVVLGRRRNINPLVVRGLVERGDHCGVHLDHGAAPLGSGNGAS